MSPNLEDAIVPWRGVWRMTREIDDEDERYLSGADKRNSGGEYYKARSRGRRTRRL